MGVDVRGRDWTGGHVPSSINLRTSEICTHPASLLMHCRRNRIHHIIFTCMYSVLRARKCAVAVETAQLEEQRAGLGAYRIRISLLAGGVHRWINHLVGAVGNARNNPYIDGFDPECWCDGGPSQGGLVHVMDALWSAGGQKALSQALTAELESLLVLRDRQSMASGTSSAHSSRRPSENKEPPDSEEPKKSTKRAPSPDEESPTETSFEDCS